MHGVVRGNLDLFDFAEADEVLCCETWCGHGLSGRWCKESAERPSLGWRGAYQITCTDGEGDVVWIGFDGKIFEQQKERECRTAEKISGNKLNCGEIQEMINCTKGAAA